MQDKLYTRKYTLSVEGETEKWYFDWLQEQINTCEKRTNNISIDAKVQQSPRKFYKDGRTRMQHKGYSYYRDNPALSIHEVVKTILEECGAD